jgi:hypothetical protein
MTVAETKVIHRVLHVYDSAAGVPDRLVSFREALDAPATEQLARRVNRHHP